MLLAGAPALASDAPFDRTTWRRRPFERRVQHMPKNGRKLRVIDAFHSLGRKIACGFPLKEESQRSFIATRPTCCHRWGAGECGFLDHAFVQSGIIGATVARGSAGEMALRRVRRCGQ